MDGYEVKPTFVIRLANGLFVAPAPRDFTSLPSEAQRFRTRWEALGEAGKRGQSLAWASIVPYAPQISPQTGQKSNGNGRGSDLDALEGATPVTTEQDGPTGRGRAEKRQ